MADEQKSAWRIAGEALPLVSLGGAVLALSYTVGHLTPFGSHWIGFLTAADFFSGIWFLAPTMLVSGIGGFLFHATGRPRTREGESSGDQTNIIFQIKNWIIGILAVGGFSALMIIRANDPENFRLISGVIVLHGVGVFFLPELYWKHARVKIILPLCFTYGAITVALGFGMMVGESTKRNQPSTYVTLINGRSLCTTLVGQFGDGVLTYNPETRTSTFISRDRIAAVAKLRSCDAA